jgi:ribosomal protein S12 methylthiotransferase
MTTTDREMTIKHGAMTKKVGMVSLGCAKNLVNSEQMMFLLNEAGFEVSGKTDGADAVVVNTCAFIESAKMEAIETILELGKAKNEGRTGKLIVAGCLPERYKNEIMPELPEIDAIVGVGGFDYIIDAVTAALGLAVRSKDIHSAGGRGKVAGESTTGENAAGEKAFFGDIDAPVSETGRIITTSPVWAYLKIAEGCDNRCGFCVIPDIRGRFRSRPMENILDEARGLADRGIMELILVAQDVTGYGLDIYGKHRLTDLLRGLCDIESLKWIRLHYLYPDGIDDELIDVIAENDKILKYIDIPIQHINDGILRKMRRRGAGGDIRSLIGRLRERVPGVVLRTSIIAGLPGEGESEFEELCGFLREAKIERAGVFQYSPEEGTPAALMDRPDPDTAARRAELIGDIQSRVIDDFNESRIGSVTTVLIEGCDGGKYYGRSFAESPEVDGYITIAGGGAPVNAFADVRITGTENGESVGEIL